jgi:hypothetical protein
MSLLSSTEEPLTFRQVLGLIVEIQMLVCVRGYKYS